MRKTQVIWSPNHRQPYGMKGVNRLTTLNPQTSLRPLTLPEPILMKARMMTVRTMVICAIWPQLRIRISFRVEIWGKLNMLNVCRLIVVMRLVLWAVLEDWALEVDEDCSSLLHYLYRRAKKHHPQYPPTFYQKSSAEPSGRSGTRNCNRDRQATWSLVAPKSHRFAYRFEIPNIGDRWVKWNCELHSDFREGREEVRENQMDVAS